MRFIGDVHGKFFSYKMVATNDGCTDSIQVGDFGLGFGEDAPSMPPGHKFIRGNHDDPSLCKTNPNWIADATSHKDVFCLGGAESIDRKFRTHGVNWWPDEQLSLPDLGKAVHTFEVCKPKYVVTHDCPMEVMHELFPHTQKDATSSLTQFALQGMLEVHKPLLWVFGHHHEFRNKTIKGVEFVCLPELWHVDISL